jgi:hypothetical protein
MLEVENTISWNFKNISRCWWTVFPSTTRWQAGICHYAQYEQFWSQRTQLHVTAESVTVRYKPVSVFGPDLTLINVTPRVWTEESEINGEIKKKRDLNLFAVF